MFLRCTIICDFKFDFWLNRLSHNSHANGFSPVCSRWWRWRTCLVTKFLLHNSQWNLFDDAAERNKWKWFTFYFILYWQMKKKISMLSKLQVFNNNLWFGEIELLQLHWVFEDIFFRWLKLSHLFWYPYIYIQLEYKFSHLLKNKHRIFIKNKTKRNWDTSND